MSLSNLSISVLDQPMVKLDSLDEVLNRDPLVEPMEPFCVIFGYEGWGEPVYLVNQMLVVLGVCIGNEGARSDMTLREHLKGGVRNDLEGHDVVAIGGDRRRVKAVLAFGYLHSAVIDHLPIMLHNIFHRLCRMNPVVDDRLGRTWHHVLFDSSVEHGDSSGGSLDRVRLVTC